MPTSPASVPVPAAESTLAPAENAGLRLALLGRAIALALASIWYVVMMAYTTYGGYVAAALLAYAVLGLAYRRVVGTARDHRAFKYAFFTLDVLSVGCVFVFMPLSSSEEVPQILAFRAYGIHYFLIFLGAAALTLSPALLMWTGATIAATWWIAFAAVALPMERTVSWADMTIGGPAGSYAAVLLDPAFIGTGNRIEETIAILALSGLLAVAVRRARSVVRDWMAAEHERHRVAELFGEFVPRSVVDQLARDRLALGPARREATVLALDVAGFTTLSEEREPRDVVALLDQLFDLCGHCIAGHGGVITNLQGDAVIASFNAPTDLPGHREAALAAALDILEAVRTTTFAGARIRVRIGLNTGPVSAGIVGGRHRRVYTVHGDTVNVAARLEQANKEHGSHLLVADTTLRAGIADGRFADMGALRLRGHREPVRVFALVEGEESAAAAFVTGPGEESARQSQA